MIVKCDQCQTRFKIPDEKVTEKGVKVRCTKCQHTFRVARAPEAAPAPVSFDPFAELEAPPAGKPPPPVTAHADPFASLEGDPSDNLTQRAARPPGITGPQPAARETTVSDDLSDLLGPMDPTAAKPTPKPPPPKPPAVAPAKSSVSDDLNALFSEPTRQVANPINAAAEAFSEPTRQVANPMQAAHQVFSQATRQVANPMLAGHPEMSQTTRQVPNPMQAAHQVFSQATRQVPNPMLAGGQAAVPPPATAKPQGEPDDFSDLFGSAPAPGAPAAPAAKPGAADGLFSSPTRQAPPSAVPAAARPPQRPPPGASQEVTMPGRPPSPAPSAGLEPGLDGAFDFGGPPDAPAPTGKGLLAEVPPAGTNPFNDPFAAPPGSLPQPSAPPSTGANPAGAAGPGPDRGMFDMPSAPPSVGPVDPFGLGSSSPAPELPAEPPSASVVIGKMKLGGTPQADGGQVGPVVEVSTGVVDPGAAKPPSTARRLSGVVVNIAIAAGLVLVLATVVGVYRNEGKLEASAFTPERVKALFVTTTDRVAVDVSNGLYETQQGRPIFYVRGEVENRGRKGGRVRVRAEILDGSQLVRAAEGYAGTSPTPEELFMLQSAQDVESLVARLDKGAADVAPGKRAPFLLAFYEYPGELAGLRLKVTVLDGDAPPAAP